MKWLRGTVAVLFCSLSMASGATAGADPVKTSTSAGDYQLVWLQLEKGGLNLSEKTVPEIDVSLYLGLRDGKTVVAWFVHPAMSGGRIVWLDKATLQLNNGSLKGDLVGRTNQNWGTATVHDYVYHFDTAVNGNEVTGTFTAEYVSDDNSKTQLRGRLTGRLLSLKQAQSENAIRDGANWPHYYGDGFGLSGPKCDSKMVDDLALARPLWKSESFIPTGYGSAPDSRYFHRAGQTDNGGGSSSPVVANGRVYQFYYYPRGPVGLDKPYGKYNDEADLTAKAKELFPKREVQQRAVVNHFRTQADEFLVCMDAATGQTLWKTVLPQRGSNLQTHKHRGYFPVALVANGVVYQAGTTGRLYALDAATGKLHWEYPDANPEPYVAKQGSIDCTAPSPVLIGDVVAFATNKGVVGVDAKSGRKKWDQSIGNRSSLLSWKGPTRTLILATDRNHETKENFTVALDPTDGKIVWRQRVDFLLDFGFPLLGGDLLIGYSVKRENIKPGENDGLAVLHAYRVSESGLEVAWTTQPIAPIVDTVGLAIQGNHVYLTAATETFCFSLAKGQQLANAKNVGGARTQTAFVADGRLFLQPEGRHGSQSFWMLDADPKQFKVLGGGSKVADPLGVGKWLPPHSWTTAYANQPIVYPLVDGRLFVRGLDAIYCYDLRVPPAR